jgi:signal transduction histidine kinase
MIHTTITIVLLFVIFCLLHTIGEMHNEIDQMKNKADELGYGHYDPDSEGFEWFE